jgi:hypothetical protein
MQLATHLCFSQFLTTAVEWITPKVTVAKKLKAIKKEFAETIKIYETIDEDTTFDNISEEKSIRRFQSMRDSNMSSTKPNIVNDYMKLISQFGFISLFSVIFPPAGLFSLIANNIQLNLKIKNL